MAQETIEVSGSEILVNVAAAGLAEAILGADLSGSLAAGGTEAILLVEDEAFVRVVTAEVLESAGYRVTLAATAAEAWKSLETRRQDPECVNLLLTDVLLPGKSGFELSKEFMAMCPGGKILLMTGCADHLACCDRFTCARGYLAKPFSVETLLRKVRAALDLNSFA